jgi:hypothetical protein
LDSQSRVFMDECNRENSFLQILSVTSHVDTYDPR